VVLAIKLIAFIYFQLIKIYIPLAGTAGHAKKQVGGKHNCFGLFLNSTGRRCWPRRVCAIFQSLSHINLKSQSNLHKICFLIRYSRQPEVRGSGARRIRDDGQHGGAKVSGKRTPTLFSQCTSPSTSIIQNVSGILWPLPLG